MKNIFSLILVSISISACSLIYSYSDNLPQRLDDWTEENKFNVALNTIDYIKPDHKDYKLIQKKKTIILKKMNAYESGVIEKSNQLSKQGYWLKALEVLDKAAENILSEDKVITHKAKLLQKRSKVIASYENDILYSQAKSLADKMELYAKIKKTVSKKESNQLDIEEFDKLRQETSIRLMQRSELHFNKGRYDNALTAINIALKLKPDEDITDELINLKKRIAKATQLKKLAYVKKVKALLNKLSQGYSHAILKETKETITWLNTIKANEKDYLGLINKLKQHLANGVRDNFEAARKLYSKGKTQEALSIWLDLKKLEPNHPKLQAYIERAKKVLEKLKKLSNKPKK